MLAPTLFNLFFDAVICMFLQKHPGHGLTVLYHPEAELVGNRKQMNCQTLIPDLEYADDMCLISGSMDKLEEMLQDLDESCNEIGLTINTRKTKIMAVAQDQKPSPRQVQLQLADEHVDVVEEFEYFGSIVMSDCELDREINVRIRKASSSFRSLCGILWYQQKIKMSTIMRVNTEAEELEKVKKDELKERRERMFMEAQMELQCTEPGCGFRVQNKAGLVNHRRQKHRAAALETI